MAFVVVLALLLLLIAALGQSWWWRGAPGQPGPAWYPHAAFYWGVFFLAIYLTWPVIRPLL